MEKELDSILQEFDEGNMTLDALKGKLLRLFGVSRRGEQLCQHSWVKHPSHPKIGAMVCLKCGSELA